MYFLEVVRSLGFGKFD